MVSIVHAARDLGRVRDISKVLVRHGFGEIVGRLGLRGRKTNDDPLSETRATGTIGVRVRNVLEDLGPVPGYVQDVVRVMFGMALCVKSELWVARICGITG